MNVPLAVIQDLPEAIARLTEAANAKKCWACGCFHSSLDTIERAYPPDQRPPELDAAIRVGRAQLSPTQYDCLGCEVCYPPLAMNALDIDDEACPTATVESRDGWPPLPGAYVALRYHSPVAICTLTDEKLANSTVLASHPAVAIVGTLYTENLGIERIIQNILTNPNIRFLILCGSDSRQAIGHLPGQSLAALAESGLDGRQRIIGARGKRPVLRNISPEAIDHFRHAVQVVDLVGTADVATITTAVADLAAHNPGPAQAFTAPAFTVMQGYIPERMVSDPAGYFVVYLDRQRQMLSLEHYANDGVLGTIIEGRSAAELYIPAVEKGLLTRLDHAAYLGRELARAEHALRSGQNYVQDAAPEQHPTPNDLIQSKPSCGCGSSCGGPQE